MIGIRELCKVILLERYNIDITSLKTVDNYRKFYDMIHRNKEILGLNEYTLEQCLSNLRYLLDFIEEDNTFALLNIKGATDEELQRVKRAKNKMKKTIQSTIVDIKDKCSNTNKCDESISGVKTITFSTSNKAEEINTSKEKNKNNVNQMDIYSLEKSIKEINTPEVLDESNIDEALDEALRQLEDVREKYKSLVNSVVPLIQNAKIQQHMSKEEIIDVTLKMIQDI